MGNTLIEKIAAAHSGRELARAGDVVEARPDLCLLDLAEFAAAAAAASRTEVLLRDPRLLLVIERAFAGGDAGALRQARAALAAAGAGHAGPARGGVLGVEALDRGAARPGGLLIGCDPHLGGAGTLGCASAIGTSDAVAAALASGAIAFAVPQTIAVRVRGTAGRWCSGRDVALHLAAELELGPGAPCFEIGGPALDALDVVERAHIASQLRCDGAGEVLLAPDEKALTWLRARTATLLRPILPDTDAHYAALIEIDVAGLEPLVRCPGTGRRSLPVGALPEIAVEQVVIGPTAGGRIEDLRLVARLLKEHGVAEGVRLMVVPASQRAYLHAAEEGIVATLLRTGAVVLPPAANAWEYDAPPSLAAGERCLATTYRAATSAVSGAEVYLASTAVAAATAVIGRIAHPDEVLRSRREAV